MASSLKPSEVSDILLGQDLQFEEIGKALQVSDGVVRIYGLDHAEAGELLDCGNGIMAVVMNLETDNVGAVLMGPTDQVKEGMVVRRTGRIASIGVNDKLAGRVIDPLGTPLDGLGPIEGDKVDMPLERKAPGVIFRQPVNEPLQTGLKAIDAMIPIGRGQRELIIGDRQTGKTAIAIDTIINQRQAYEAGDPVFCIYVAIVPWWWPQRPRTRPPCSTTLPLPAPPSESISGTRAVTPWWSTTISPSRLWHTARCPLSCAVPPDVRHTPEISSTSTAVCWSVPPASSTSRKWPKR